VLRSWPEKPALTWHQKKYKAPTRRASTNAKAAVPKLYTSRFSPRAAVAFHGFDAVQKVAHNRERHRENVSGGSVPQQCSPHESCAERGGSASQER
jgi:hypothetical protein